MHSHTGTHRKKARAAKKEGREINFWQHPCISINPPVYAFTLFILVSEPSCPTLFADNWRVLADVCALRSWWQMDGFIRQVWQEVSKGHKWTWDWSTQQNYSKQPWLAGWTFWGADFAPDSTQHLGEASVSRSVLEFNNSLIFFSEPLGFGIKRTWLLIRRNRNKHWD